MDAEKLKILNDIKEGIITLQSSIDKLSIEELLSKDEQGITYLDYICKNKVTIPYSLQNAIPKNKEAFWICAKNKYIAWAWNLDEEILFTKENDITLFEYILSNNITCYALCKSVINHFEMLDLYAKYNKFDNLFNLSNEFVTKLYSDPSGVEIVKKYMNDEKFIKYTINKCPSDILINFCINNNTFEFLKYAPEETLLTKIDNKTILEALLDKGIEPLFYAYDFKQKETFDILEKRERPDLMYNADIDLLFSIEENGQNYYQKLIDMQISGQEVNLDKFSYGAYYNRSAETTAKQIMYLAQKDAIGYIPSLSGSMLTYKEYKGPKTVLEYLVEMDRDLTVNKIIKYCSDKRTPEVAVVLRQLGINDTLVDLKPTDIQFSEEFIREYNEGYDKDCISKYEDLLTELRDLFYNDGISDKEAVDALVKSYRYTTSKDDPLAILELKQLIAIKKQNMETFAYKKTKDGSVFNKKQGVLLDNNVISTINHETSHALHYYLADNYVPENYQEVIRRARESEHVIEKVKEYARKYREIRQSTESSIDKTKINSYYDEKYTGEKIEPLKEFLESSKEEKKSKLKDKYSEDVLDTILDRTYSPEEFIKQRKEIEVIEVVDAILRSDYDAFMTISDILDAVFLGKFRSGILRDNERETIEPAYGHGIHYYSMETHGFDEMIANYGAIIKGKFNKEILDYLRSIVGDEVVDMIADVYENRILKSQVYYKKEEMEEAAKFER